MDSLIFALNATLPVFLVMVVGWFLRQRGLLPKEFTGTADKFVFRVASPCFLFYDISTSDFYGNFDVTFVLFCVIGSTLMFLISWGVALTFIKDKSIVSAFGQAAARGSAAILGIAFMQNLYGEAGQLPMMIAASVPIFNVMSVIILTFSAPPEENVPKLDGRALVKDSLYKIVTNPLIIGIALGLIVAILRIEVPVILNKTISNIGGLTSPLALLCIGADFDGKKAINRIKPTIWASLFKLVIFPALFLPAAIAFGFTHDKLIAILIMTGTATTVSCYVMAKNMRGDAVLTSSIVVVSTLFSAITMTFWLWLLRVMGLI